jgi:hypothetical protein
MRDFTRVISSRRERRRERAAPDLHEEHLLGDHRRMAPGPAREARRLLATCAAKAGVSSG